MQTLQIRNSIAEFLIFTKQNKAKTIEVIVDDESVWLNQKLIAESFALSKLEKYRIIQDKLFEFDFDKFL